MKNARDRFDRAHSVLDVLELGVKRAQTYNT
jgi:hypothetical protein